METISSPTSNSVPQDTKETVLVLQFPDQLKGTFKLSYSEYYFIICCNNSP